MQTAYLVYPDFQNFEEIIVKNLDQEFWVVVASTCSVYMTWMESK